MKRKHFIIALMAMLSCFAFTANAQNVAKVGDTEYDTWEKAYAAWTNGTTLTLLADVTLSDVIRLSSTEHHILDLSTYTMTAAKNQDAIVIKACGTGDSERTAITIKADATNPGGINAGTKCVIYYKYADGGISGTDRPIIKIEGGVFTGSTSTWGTAGIYTIGAAARKCATLNISGGTFKCSINGATKSKLIISGGVFNYSVGSTGDNTAIRKITGGKFKSFGWMTNDNKNGKYDKFTIGSDMEKYDVGVYVDKTGYLCVGGPVITALSPKYKAVASNATKWSPHLMQSSAHTQGLYYEDAAAAIKKHGEANVTVFEQVKAPTVENVAPENATEEEKAVVEEVISEVTNNAAVENYTVEMPAEVVNFSIELAKVEVAEETTPEAPEAPVTVVTEISYTVTPSNAAGEKVSAPSQPITFRLPLPSNWASEKVKVIYNGTALEGDYTVMTENGAKYVEVESQSFSTYTVQAIVPLFAGEGTEASPYIIDSSDKLAALSNSVNGGEAYAGVYFKLTSDITLSGEWTAIGKGSRSSKSYTGNAFKGVFDGGNNTISGLTITSTTAADAAIGLFGVVDGGTVKNLNLTNVNINVPSSNLAGAAIGMMLNKATADNITVSGAIVGNDGVGGIVGRMIINGTIANCTNNASVTTSYGGIGGIVGKPYYDNASDTSDFATITNCINNGTITAGSYAGGIAGLARANVTGCVNNGEIKGGSQTGGIIGELIAAGTVSGNENKGKVSGTKHVGGIIGDYTQTSAYSYYNVTIANNINRGEISATQQCAAILGVNNIDGFTAMTATGNVSYYYVNGLELFGNPEDMTIDATNKFIVPVAQVGTETYYTLAEAAAAAQAGSEIKLLADVTVEGTLALPAGIKLTSNGHTINGSIRMLGDLELNGPLTITGGLSVGKGGEMLTATLSGDKLTANYFMFQRGTYTINADIDAVYGYLSYNGTFEVNSTIHTTGTNGEVLYINGNVTLNEGAVLDSDNSVFVCNDNAVLTLKPGSKVDSKVSITTSGAKLNIDATGMAAGASANITGTVTNSGNGTIAVVGNDKLEASIVNGKVVLAAKPVAKIGEQSYATLDEAVAAAKEGDKIILVDDAELLFASNPMYNNVYASEIDLNGKTMTIKKGDVRFSNTTIKNGNIVVEPKTYNGTAIFLTYSKNLTLESVKVTATGVVSTYLFGLEGTSNLNLLNGSEIVINNESLVNIGSIIADNGNGNTVTIKDSKIEITNSNARLYLGGTNGNITVENSDIDLTGVKEGFYLRAGQTLAITGTSTVDITLNSTEGRYGINLTDLTATYTKAETATVNATVYEIKVAKIGDVEFKTLQEAVDAVQEGETITLIYNVVLAERVTIPANKTLTIDLNGKSISMEESIIATAYAINNLGNLTITDGVGGGSINARGMYNGYGNGGDNVASAKLTINGGTFNAKGTDGGAAIFNYGIAEVNAGTFTSIGGYSLNNQAGSTMTIAAGVSANNGVYNSNATLTIGGGEISGNRSGCHVIYAWNSTLTINGGEFYNNNSGNATIMSAGTSEVTINGGTISIKDGRVPGNGNTYTSCLTDAANTAKIIVNGGTFNGGFRVQAGTSMTINGGSFNDCTGSNYNIYGTAVVKGGTFTDATAQAFAKNNVAAGYMVNENGSVAESVAYIVGKTSHASLAAAYEAAVNGDVIVLNESVTTFPVIKKAVTFKGGKENAAVEINYGLAQNFTAIDGTVRFENLTFNKPLFTEQGGTKPGLTIEFEGCNFNVPSDQGYAILIGTSWSNSVVKGLKVNKCNFKYVGDVFKGGYMLYVQCVNEVTITNNTIDGNNLYRGAIHLGDATEHATVATVSNNTIKNFCRGVMMGNRVAGSSATISGNTFDNINYSDKDSKPAQECAPIFIHSNATSQALQIALTNNEVENCANPMIYSEDTDLIKYYVTEFTGNTVDGSAVEFANSYNAPKQIFPVASIKDAEYFTLQAAINAVKNGETVNILLDIAENVTVSQVENVSFVIDGQGKKFDGTIYVDGNSRNPAAETLTIQNVNFETSAKDRYFVDANDASADNRYSHNVTIKNCNFTAVEGSAAVHNAVAARFRQAYNIKIEGGVFTNMHSVLQAYGVIGVEVSGVKTVNSKSGVSFGTSTNAVLKNVEFAGCVGYGVRADAEVNTTLTIENAKIDAFIPVVVRKATANYNVAFNGENTMTATNTDGIWFAAGSTEYETNGTMPTDATGKVRVTLNDATLSKDGVYGDYVPVAKIGDVEYTSLQAAINAVKNNETIKLIADVEENVTVTEKTGLYYTIDGASKQMTGTITVSSLSDTNDNRRITIKNINFVDTVNGRDFITSTATNHYPRITVEGCSFTGTGKEAANSVAVRLKSSHSVVIKDCTGTGLHSFLQNTSGWNLTIENVKVTESKSGLALGTVQGVTVKGCEIAAAGYGIRLDANTYNNNAVIENNTISAFIPVVVRKANTESNIVFSGENTMTATNTDGLWCAIGTSEYETNGTMPTAATGKVKVTIKDANLDGNGVYGAYTEAKIGNAIFGTFQEALDAAVVMSGDVTIEIMAGTYAQDINLTNAAITTGNVNARPNITFKAAEGQEVVLAGTVTLGYREQKVGASMWNGEVTFNGITFNHAEDGKHSLEIHDVKGIALVNCKVIGDGEYGISSPGGNGTTTANFTSCTFENGAMQVTGQLGANLVVDNSVCNDFSFNVQGGAAPGMTIKNTVFNLTLTDAHVGESFYAVRTNACPVNITATKVNVDSKVSSIAADQSKWAIFYARKDANAKWNVADCEVNLTDAAMAQTELLLTKNEAGEANGKERMVITNLTSTSNDVSELVSRAEGYSIVDSANYKDGVLDFNGKVAKIGNVGYPTLAKALSAAKSGETVTLVNNVTESVTINKNLTLDGAGYTVTGMITANGKGTYVTIKNINFNGNNNSIYYAIRTDNINKLIVEDCTVDSYTYGFLYANKSNNNFSVKNVAVTNCPNYGAALMSFNNATFENFTVTGAVNGIIAGNADASDVTIKNSTMTDVELPLYIQTKGSSKVTFEFAGVNDMGKAEYYTSQYVNVVAAAQVGTKVCGSLQDAVVAANDGETVKVLSDLNMTTANFVTQVDGYATLVNVAGKAVTIDLNGKKVTVNAARADLNGKAKNNMLMSVFHADPNGTLTLTDSSAEGTGTVELKANDATVYGLIVSENAYDKSNPGKIIVNGGNYIADKVSDSMVFADINEVITVNGGNFHLGNVGSTGVNGKPWIFNASGNNSIHINVNGGTYNANVAKQYWIYEVNLGEGLTTTNNGDGTWTVVPAVAVVGEELYGTIQEAFDEVTDGNTVKLIADVTLDTKKYTTQVDNLVVLFNVKGKTVTFDLNGKKIDVNASAANLGGKMLAGVFSADLEGNFIITDSSDEGTGAVKVTVNDAKVYSIFLSENAGDKTKSGRMTVNAGTFTTVGKVSNAMIFADTDKVVTINGGTFICDGVSMGEPYPWMVNTTGNNTLQVVVNGGTFNADINHQYRPFEVFVPENLAVKNNGTGTWTIVPAQAYVTEMLGNYVNEPGNNEHKVGYATIAEAIAATNDLGKTVTILAGDYTQDIRVNKAGITVQGEVDENGNNLANITGCVVASTGTTVKNLNVKNELKGKYDCALSINHAKDVTIDSVNLSGYNAITMGYADGKITIKNSVIEGSNNAVHFDGNAGGVIAFENSTITGWCAYASTIDSVSYTNCTLNKGNSRGQRFYNANVNFNECTFGDDFKIELTGKNQNVSFTDADMTMDDVKALMYKESYITSHTIKLNGTQAVYAVFARSKYYNTLQAAIDDMPADGKEYWANLKSNNVLTEGVTVPAGVKVAINLAGYNITGTPAEAKAYAVITNNGTLTITNMSTNNGTVLCDHTLAGSTSYAVNTITNFGTLNIEDGVTIENKSTAQHQIGYAIDNNSTSTDAVVNIYGGKVIASGSLYYDGIRQFCNSETKENSVVVEGGEVSTIWMQNPSDGATKNTKDVKGSIAIIGGNVGVLSLEPSANFEAAVTGGHVGEISYFQTAEDRDLVEFVTGGTFGTEIGEAFLAMGYQLTGNTAPYEVEYTGRREAMTFVDGEFTEYANENDIEVGTLTYKRNFSAVWTPFYVPFEVDVKQLAEQGLEVAYINGVRRDDEDYDGILDDPVMEVIYIHGGKADGTNKTLKANYPYFVKSANKDVTVTMEIVLENATLFAASDKTYDCTTMTEKYDIIGNSSVITVKASDNMNLRYTMAASGWSKRTKDSSLKPFRFHMEISSRDGSEPVESAASSVRIVVRGHENEDGTTTIYDVVGTKQNSDVIYDIHGRRVLDPQKGNLYIINGKKVVY